MASDDHLKLLLEPCFPPGSAEGRTYLEAERIESLLTPLPASEDR